MWLKFYEGLYPDGLRPPLGCSVFSAIGHSSKAKNRNNIGIIMGRRESNPQYPSPAFLNMSTKQKTQRTYRPTDSRMIAKSQMRVDIPFALLCFVGPLG